jgi:uncharacterized protein YcfL
MKKLFAIKIIALLLVSCSNPSLKTETNSRGGQILSGENNGNG